MAMSLRLTGMRQSRGSKTVRVQNHGTSHWIFEDLLHIVPEPLHHYNLHDMTFAQIQSAIERGGPFSIQMADGKEYKVPHRDYISIAPKGSFVVVFDDQEHAFVLPLLTMTGLTYNVSEAGAP